MPWYINGELTSPRGLKIIAVKDAKMPCPKGMLNSLPFETCITWLKAKGYKIEFKKEQ